MASFTIKQLRYFEALALHRHFGRAAEASAISQPALSVQIKELEEALGVQLFERSARQVRLTSFGESFEARVREILRRVDDLDDFARAARGKLAGRFRIGVIPTIAPYLLPHLIGNLARSHPGLDLHVRETLTPKLVQELLQGQLDTAIVALPVAEPAFTEKPIFEERFVLVRPESEADKPAPRGEELRDMRLLLLEEGHCLREQTLSFCSTSGAVPRDGLDGSSLSTLVQMVGAGIGVTMIPEMAIPVETRSARVCCTPLEDPQPGRTIGMIWRRTSPLTEAYDEIAEVVARSAEALRRPGMAA
ncbi:hydrogen peroxide-inducible genes activator [Marimonas sp. MJW-29]|uniref:Hydrogen peroxide-inducible genes activator n=1 Tax=Sulfitobacter sediminis TaxID=3234186 RepID=A0ABV3RKH8_9RHOB